MIVCMCHGIGCSKLRSVIDGGAQTVEAVGAACGAGTDCGSCRGMIEDMIEEAAEEADAARVDGHGRTHLRVAQPTA